MRTSAKRVISLLFSIMMVLQPLHAPIAPADGVADLFDIMQPNDADTPVLVEAGVDGTIKEIEISSQSVNAHMLNIQGNLQGASGRNFRINWLPDNSIAPNDELTVLATYGDGQTATQTIAADADGKWVCAFPQIPSDASVTYTVEGLNRAQYYDYPSSGDAIAIAEIAETTVHKTWYNVPEAYRKSISVLVTMVSGENYTPGGTGNIMDTVEGLQGEGLGDLETIIDSKVLRFPKYNSDGKRFHSFQVQEITLDGHLENLDGDQKFDAEEDIHLHNTMRRALKVTKEWEGSFDDGNDEVEVCLIRTNDNEIIQTKRIHKESDGTWPTIAFDEQPLGGKLDGVFQPFTYHVVEIGVYKDANPDENLIDGYQVTYPPAPNWQTTGFTVLNSKKIDDTKETVVEIVKTWDDARGLGFHLARFHIIALNGSDGSITQVVISGTGNETVTERFTLPKYNPETGEEYIYHVEEVPLDDFYTTPLGTETGDNKKTWRFLNQSKKRAVTVRKVWVDDNPSVREDVTLYLLRDGERIHDPVSGRDMSITLTNGATSYTFEDLPRFETPGGREYVYTVEEPVVPDGYYEVEKGLTIENHKLEDEGDPIILVTKKWLTNGKYYETLPEVTLQLYKRVAGQADEPVGRPMVMEAGTDLSRMFTILQNEGIVLDPTATYVVKELTDGEGKWLVSGGEVVFTGNIGRAVIENILQEHLVEREATRTTLIIRKTWQATDAPSDFATVDDYIATLPADFVLTQSYDGGPYGVPTGLLETIGGNGTYNAGDGTVVIRGNDYILLRVPEMDELGKRYTYQVTESDVDGFARSRMISDFSFIYTNIQETIPFHVRKTWENLSARGKLDVVPVTITLFRRAGGEMEQVGEPVVISNFNYEGSGLNIIRWGETALGSYATHAYINGQFVEYEYYVVENYDGLTDKRYFTTEGREMEDGYTNLRNIYNNENQKVKFSVTKDWTGGKTGEEFPSVTIWLYADGVKIDEVELVKDSAVPWSHTFRDLPKFKESVQGTEPEEIIYTAHEVAIGGEPLDNEDTVRITEDGVEKVYKRSREYMMGSDDFYVVNSLVTYETDLLYDIVGFKDWAPLPPGVALPDAVTFVLYQDGVYYDERTLTADTNWECRFEDMPYFNDTTKRPYAYVLLEENPPPGFYPLIKERMDFSRDDKTGELYAHATLINIPTDKRDVTFIKEWEGDGGNTALRVDQHGNSQVVLTLSFGGGTMPVILTPNENGDWETTVELAVTTEQNGEEYIQYEMKEFQMPNYNWKENLYEGVAEDPENNRFFHLLLGEEDAVITVVNAMHTSTSIGGAKKWIDRENIAGLRPPTLSVVLEQYLMVEGSLVLQTTSDVMTVGTGGTVDIVATPSEVDEGAEGVATLWRWNYLVEKFNGKGQPYIYHWREVDVPSHYSASGEDLKSYQADNAVKPMVNRLPLVDVVGTKTWNNTIDGTDYGPIHPGDAITVQLMRKAGGGAPEEMTDYTATIDADNQWSWSWENLPKLDPAGVPYVYYVVEVSSTEGYESADEAYVATETGFRSDVANTIQPGSLKVQKRWHADGAGEQRRTIDIELSATIGGVPYTWSAALKEVDGWAYTFENLPVYDSASGTTEKIVYTLRELDLPESYILVTLDDTGEAVRYVPVEDGAVSVTLDVGKTVETTLHNAKLLMLSGNKRWQDASNRHKTRPVNNQDEETITIHLQRDAGNGFVTIATETFTGTGDTWSFTWPEALPAGNDTGVTYAYRFVEDVPTGYLCSNIENAIAADGSETLVNTLETVNLHGEKAWSGPVEEPLLRPTQIEIKLMRKILPTDKGEEVDKAIITVGENEPDEWRFDGWPKKAPSGAAYTYYVEETQLTAYDTEVDGMYVRNALKVGRVDVDKTWFEPEGASLERPNVPITLTLYATVPDGKGGMKTIFTRRLTVDPPSNVAWTRSFENVPLYDMSSGTAVRISYLMEESTIAGYKLRGADEQNRVPVVIDPQTSLAQVDLVNERDTFAITVSKVWRGDGAVWQDTQPAAIDFSLEQYDHADEVVKVHKLTMRRAQDHTWPSITFAGLDESDAQGRPYRYELLEPDIPGYARLIEPTVENDRLTGFSVTNTWVPLTLRVEKEWIDAGDINGLRPDEITLRLMRRPDLPGATFEQYGDIETLGASRMIDKDTWEIVWPVDVPAFNADKIAYLYQFEEVDAHPSYRIIQGTADVSTGEALINELPMTEMKGSKRWNEPADSSFGDLTSLRPDTVRVGLWRTLGDVTKEIDSKPVGFVNGNENWAWSFENLPVYADYANNVRYTYEVREEKVPGYISEKENDDIVNTLQTMDIEVWKAAWGDEGYPDERPQTLSVTLQAAVDGQVIAEYPATLRPDAWRHTYSNMPRVIDGGQVAYSIKEDVPSNYIEGIFVTEDGRQIAYPVMDEQETESGILFTLENRLRLQEITLTKNWHEGAFEGKLSRPRYLYIDLWSTTGKPGDKESAEARLEKENYRVEVGQSNPFTVTFEGLPTERDGKPLHYWAEEHALAGYRQTGAPGTMILDNTLDTVDIEIVKRWDERETIEAYGDDAAIDRPKAVSVILTGSIPGHEIYRQTHMLSPDSWTTTVRGLPRYAYQTDGTTVALVRYQVQEAAFEAYESSVDASNMTPAETEDYAAVITNTLRTVSVSVTKDFAGDDTMIASGVNPRPSSVLVHLYRRVGQDDVDANFHLTRRIEGITSSRDSYTTVFAALPAYDAQGRQYTYFTDEDDVPGYRKTLAADGLTITNTLETTRVTGVKRWIDDMDEGGVYRTRPAEIVLVLTGRAEDTAEPEIRLEKRIAYDGQTSEQPWSFENLPRQNVTGAAYVYDVTELPVPGYATEITRTTADGHPHFVFVNSLKRVNILVQKIWMNDADYLAYRPEKGLAIRLIGTGQDGAVYYDATGTASPAQQGGNMWTASFDGLPRYGKDGKVIRYVVSEEQLPGYELIGLSQPEVDENEGIATYAAVLTNRLVTRTYSGSKTWRDNENRHQTRPESISVTLKRSYRDTAGADRSETVETIRVQAPWQWRFAEMPVYHTSGAAYAYYVEEGGVSQYTAAHDGTDRLSLVNTLNSLDVAVTKHWQDQNNRYLSRPQSIDIELLSSTGIRYPGVMTAATGWKFTFTGLPKVAENGAAITYTLSEKTPAGYRVGSIVQPTAGTGYEAAITNELLTTQVTVRKAWIGGTGTSRPSVTISLMDGRTHIDSVQLGGTTWMHTFDSLPRYRQDGTEIQYSVAEAPVANYRASISRTSMAEGSAFTVTNTYVGTPTPAPSNRVTAPPYRPNYSAPTASSTPAPRPTQTIAPDATRLMTIVDLDIPAGSGINLNLGDCFD